MTGKSDAPQVEGGVRVTFARAWTIGNYTYKPDETAALEATAADEALRLGYARPADQKES